MPNATLYQVYVLRNTGGRFYIGLSENVAARLLQHNNGVSRWTRSRGRWSLAWVSNSLLLSAARKLERHLKNHLFGDASTLETYSLSLHDALPISEGRWFKSSPRNQFM